MALDPFEASLPSVFITLHRWFVRFIVYLKCALEGIYQIIVGDKSKPIDFFESIFCVLWFFM